MSANSSLAHPLDVQLQHRGPTVLFVSVNVRLELGPSKIFKCMCIHSSDVNLNGFTFIFFFSPTHQSSVHI